MTHKDTLFFKKTEGNIVGGNCDRHYFSSVLDVMYDSGDTLLWQI